MGMDVYGRRPKSEDGKYFRANVWGWRPIHALCQHAIDRFELGFDTDYWGSNDGKGLKCQRDCTKLADAFETILNEIDQDTMDEELSKYFIVMDHPKWGKTLAFKPSASSGMLVDPEGRFIKPEDAKKNNVQVHSPYSVELDYLKEWVRFLRSCGGFKIW